MSMKHNLKRYIGLLLVIVMVAGMMPASALADTFTSNVIGPLTLEEEEVDFGEPDPSADLESEGDFIASLHEVPLKGLPYNQRLLAVAETQLGYTESAVNFVVKEDEVTGKKAKFGITRYGQWYGLPYEDWCAMFISFCLHYGQVPNYLMPADSGAFTWVNRLQSMGLFRWRSEYTPKPGDLIFFDNDLSGQSDHVGIVSSLFTVDGVDMVETIEGNHSKTVEKFSYPLISLEIQGYGVMSDENPDAAAEEKQLVADYASGTDTYRVTMTYTPDALIPANAVLVVSEILPGTPEYDAYVAESAGALGWEEGSVSDAKVLDISVFADGVEVQPAAPVNVEMVLVDQPAEDWNVVHFGKEETQVLESTAEGDAVSFATDGFSIFVFAKSKLEKTLVASDGNTYNITLTYDPDKAGIPENAELKVTEILQEVSEDPDASSEYDEYLSRAEGALEKNQRVTFARFFDITIMADGQEIQPATPVEVKIELANEELTAEDTEDVKAVHFSSEGDVTALDTTREEQTVTFNAEGFSIYGIVGTETLTGGFVSADGSTYEVNVTYGSEAGIPKGSTLKLVEYTEDRPEYKQAKEKLYEYREEVKAQEEETGVETEEAGEEEKDEEKSGFSALGISIIDPDGNEIEPKGEVSVVITMKTLPAGFEAEDLLATMEVHHLAVTDGAITVEKVASPVLEGSEITANDNGAVAEFVTESFSTYTITWGYQNWNTTTLHFVNESGQELTGVKLTSSGATIDDSWIRLTDLISSNDTTMDLRNAFTVDGKTLSNTHIGSYQNLGNNNARQIVANEIRREDNNFRYRTFNEGSDYAGSTWRTIPNNSDLYLVYSDVPTGSGGGGGTPDDPDAPDFGDIGNSKKITDNENGTYTLNLSVTGQAQTASENNHVNVAIVLDTSSSMVNQGTGRRLQDAKRALVGTTQAEIEASVAHKLLSNNTTDDPEIVELAFITFDGQSHDHLFGTSNWTTDERSFRTTVNDVGTASGTNWEDAMRAVGNLGGDGDPTYVIFITDGQPSRYWRGDTPNVFVEGEGSTLAANDEARALIRDKGVEIYGIFGWGSSEFYEKDLLGQLIDYAYNEDGKRNTHRFNASGTEDVIEVLESIMNTINLRFGFADVEINDGITGLTSTEVALATVQSESFEYTITYVDAADNSTHTVNCTKNSDGTISIPSVTYNVKDPDHPGQYKSKTTEAVTVTGASYANGRVQWHLEKVGSTDPYILEEAWTYKVGFVVWPSQHSFDLVAALNNDQTLWGKDYTFVDNGETITFAQYQNQITGGPYGPFSLKTNTDASVSYKEVTAKTTDEGTTYTYSDPKTITIPYNDVMKLTAEEMTVEKLWNNPLDSRPVEDQVELSVTLDGKEFLSHLILNAEDEYKHNAFIACGVITEDDTGYDVKETGHDFTFTEVHDENAYYWNLEAETYRPMLINGTLTLLIKVDSASEADYQIGDEYFKKGPEGNAAIIQATNVRRSRLNLRKFVTDETDGTVDPEAEFTYTVKINEASNEDIYFSVFGTNGAQYLTPEQGVKVSENVTPTMMQDGSENHQYYVVHAGAEFTVNAKAGWSLMFLNLSNGTTYTINESSMPAGFELGGEAPSADEYYYATPGDPSSRTTRPVDHNMTFNGATTSGTITQSNTQYRVDYTNVWKSKEVTLVKVKEDGQTEIGGAEFSITKKNVNGRFDSVTTFTSSTEDDVLGEVFKLGYGIYCLTETKAPDGYIILTNKIYFNVTTGGIVLCDENGDTAEYENAVVSGDDHLTVTIKNTPGVILPETGGVGTDVFAAIGGLTALFAGAVLVLRRRRKAFEA